MQKDHGAMCDFQPFEDLLKRYVNCHFPKKQKEKVTFFDVTGYPHYENVASNVLKFFFDPNEEHGFGDLWFKSLLEAYNQKVDSSCAITHTDSLTVANIFREFSDDSGKRIDLLIDARPILVVVENKIGASVYNPLETYTEMVKRYAKDNQINDPTIVKIVLSVSEEKLNPREGFVNVTYGDLFKKVKPSLLNYGRYKKWVMFVKDFIANIEKRKEVVHMVIDEKWTSFVNDNQKTFKDMFERFKSDEEARLSILKTINDDLTDIGSIVLKKGVYDYSKSSYVSQYIDLKNKDGSNICFETYMMRYPTGKEREDFDKLYISLWCRRKTNYDFSEVLKAIGKENAPIRITEGPGTWGKHHILDEITLCNDLRLPEVVSKIRKYVMDTVSYLKGADTHI